MGFGAWWHWAIVVLVVVLVFGTKKLANLGSDLGKAVKGFKEGIKDAQAEASSGDDAAKPKLAEGQGQTVEGEAKKEKSEA